MTDRTDRNLEYLTVDSIQWASGDARPRMPLEAKRAKHRVHQRHFMLRQRQRIEQLQSEVRQYTLQLQLVEATQAVAVLAAENEALRQQLRGLSPAATTQDNPVPLDMQCQDSQADTAGPVVNANEEAAILELLDLLPDANFFQVDSPVDVDAFAWCEDEHTGPLPWPTSSSCAARFQALRG